MKIAEIRSALYRLADADYKNFNCSLIPNVDRETVVGVRIPALRKLAAEIKKAGLATEFMAELPHKLYEENHLHSFLIEKEGDYDECVRELERFLPFVDNWAVCDSMSPKVLARYPERLIAKIREWLLSPNEYTVRFALKMLMTNFLDEHFAPEYLELASSVNREEYYIKMMVAWYFATALAKQYDAAVLYLENRRLPSWVHNKTIQKARESFRVSNEQKTYLKTLIVKQS